MLSLFQQYYLQLCCAVGIAILALLVFDALGYVITRITFVNEPKHQIEPITLFVGTTSAIAIFSVIYFLQYTTQHLPIAFLAYGILKNFKRVRIKNSEWLTFWPWQHRLAELAIVVILILLRFYQLTDASDHDLQTENCDMYNYMDNMVYQTMYKVENIFTEFESQYFGFSHRYSNYHFWEYNLGILLKYLWPFQNYTFFHFCLLPFILGAGIIGFARVLAHHFQLPYIHTLIITLAFATFHRATNAFWYILKPLDAYININSLFYFPFHAIQDAYFLYPTSFIPKVSVLILGFSGYFWAYKERQALLRYYAIAFLAIANVAYLPFIFFFEALNVLSGRWRFTDLAFTILPAVFIIIHSSLRNSGLQVDAAGQATSVINIKPIISPKGTYLLFNESLLYLFGNFYLPIIYGVLLLWVLLRTPTTAWTLALCLSFPFLFYDYQILGKIFLAAWALLIYINRKSITSFFKMHTLAVKLITAFFFTALVVHFTPFMLESFQIRLTVLVLLLFFMPLYYSLWALKQAPQRKYAVLACCVLFLANNAESNAFYFKRIFYPGESATFVRDFLKMLPDDSRINGVYLTRFNELLYPYTDKPGFNIQNYSDSIFTTCASFNLMSRQDTLELMRKNLFTRHQKWPFNQYIMNQGKGKSYDEQLIGFMRHIKARVVLLNKNTPKPSVLNSYIIDSLYCQQFKYWAFKIDTAKLQSGK